MLRDILNRVIALLAVVMIASQTTAQTVVDANADNDVTQGIGMLGAGYTYQHDGYLSPQVYDGFNVQYKYEWWLRLAKEKPWSQIVKLQLNAGRGINESYSNSMLHGHVDIAWGAHYHWSILPQLSLMGGGIANFNLVGKMIGRNVNNPGSADGALTIDLSGGLDYDFKIKNSEFRLRYMLQMPIVGCMFVPEIGASYYEMFSLWHLDNAFHLSAPHNMYGINHGLYFDMQFRRSTWRIGVEHETRHWHANQVHFSRNSITGLIGYIIDVRYKRGAVRN